MLALAAKVKFVIDPDNPYPNNYTGHIRATLNDGSVIEERQPYLRGGAQEPLTRQDVTDKFALNAQHGGWNKAQSDAALKLMAGLYEGQIDLCVVAKLVAVMAGLVPAIHVLAQRKTWMPGSCSGHDRRGAG